MSRDEVERLRRTLILWKGRCLNADKKVEELKGELAEAREENARIYSQLESARRCGLFTKEG